MRAGLSGGVRRRRRRAPGLPLIAAGLFLLGRGDDGPRCRTEIDAHARFDGTGRLREVAGLPRHVRGLPGLRPSQFHRGQARPVVPPEVPTRVAEGRREAVASRPPLDDALVPVRLAQAQGTRIVSEPVRRPRAVREPSSVRGRGAPEDGPGGLRAAGRAGAAPLERQGRGARAGGGVPAGVGIDGRIVPGPRRGGVVRRVGHESNGGRRAFRLRGGKRRGERSRRDGRDGEIPRRRSDRVQRGRAIRDRDHTEIRD